MGQTFLAVVYGVKWTQEINDALREDSKDEYSDIVEFPMNLKPIETGEGLDVLGYSVAVGGYAESCEVEFEVNSPVAMSELEVFLRKPLEHAKRRWLRLAKWALEKRKLPLASPELILVQMERA